MPFDEQHEHHDHGDGQDPHEFSAELGREFATEAMKQVLKQLEDLHGGMFCRACFVRELGFSLLGSLFHSYGRTQIMEFRPDEKLETSAEIEQATRDFHAELTNKIKSSAEDLGKELFEFAKDGMRAGAEERFRDLLTGVLGKFLNVSDRNADPESEGKPLQ